MIKYLGFVGLSLALAGCVSMNVEEDNVCDSETLNFGSFPSLPSNNLPTQDVPLSLTATIPFDFSNDLNKVKDVASTLNLDVRSFVIEDNGGDLSWVKSVDIQIKGVASDGSTPQAQLGTADSSLNVKLTMDSATLLHYLESGSNLLTFTVNGVVSPSTLQNVSSMSNQVNFCLGISGSVDKKL